jgi:hypothetical protein
MSWSFHADSGCLQWLWRAIQRARSGCGTQGSLPELPGSHFDSSRSACTASSDFSCAAGSPSSDLEACRAACRQPRPKSCQSVAGLGAANKKFDAGLVAAPALVPGTGDDSTGHFDFRAG